MVAFDDTRKPDWAKWRLIPNPTILDVVALSLNIAPEQVRFWISPSGMHRTGLFLVAPDGRPTESQEFADRVEIVAKNYRSMVADGTPIQAGFCPQDPVSLSRFVRWVRTVARWETPPEFAQLDVPEIALAESELPLRSFQGADEPLVQEIVDISNREKISFTAAAKRVVDRARRTGSEESAIRRLVRRAQKLHAP